MVALLLMLVAVFCTLAASSVPFRDWTRATEATEMLVVPTSANLGYVVFLVILAAAVARRKRVAWWILLLYFGLATVLSALHLGLAWLTPDLLDTGGAGMSVALWIYAGVAFLVSLAGFVLLLLARDAFYARTQRVSLLRACGVLVGLLAVFVLVGYGLVRLAPGSLQPGERLGYTLEKVLGGVIRVDLDSGHPSGWVSFLLGLFAAIALFAALWALFRSQRRHAVLSVPDERRIRDLLRRFGQRDSLGYFATRRDKEAIFAADGAAAISFRVVAGVCLAAGDPVGPEERWHGAITAWLEHARRYAWVPAVMGASESGARAYRDAGLTVLELGDEAILRVREFGLEGREMAPVRRAAQRLEQAGYRTRIRRQVEVPEQEMATLVRLADDWRHGADERGFSMALSRFGDPSDPECVLVQAVDAAGNTAGLLSFVPWGSDGLSLDLMRRRPNAENGLTEFMVTELVAVAPRLGVTRLSLNFAVFRSAFEEGGRIGAGPAARLWRGLLLFLSRWWQLESLYRSNVKYRPHWSPRFLCFGDRRSLPLVGLASAIAEGFLVLPGAYGQAQPRAPELEDQAREDAGEAARESAARVPAVPRSEQEQVRLARLAELRDAGVETYPVGFDRTDDCATVRSRYPDLPPDHRTGDKVSIAGRVLRIRDHGGVCFATLRDWSGDLQLLLDAGPELDRWRRGIDIGDHVGVSGEVITSRRGELSVEVRDWALTAKCLRPLPDKWRGLTDPEARVRQRYVDLIVSNDPRDVLRQRSAIIRSLRDSLHTRGFVEVETPILQPIHGGANANPFTTHINAYDLDLYLRIAPELYLKRLCVGGVEKVFELGRTFRNEGVSYKHNPEFTMLEAYQAYADYLVMRDLTRELVQRAMSEVFGTMVITHRGERYDLSGEWPTISVGQALSAALGEEIGPDTPVRRLRTYAEAHDIVHLPDWTHGELILELYEHLVESKTTTPTFYTDFPTEVSVLTRRHRRDPRLAEKWDLVAFGTELGTAYSELVDPIDQRQRLTEQSLLAAQGDPEAMELDEDFLTALEYAMPPSGGLGIGVDRLVMLLTGRSIRETLPFPLVRPQRRERPTATALPTEADSDARPVRTDSSRAESGSERDPRAPWVPAPRSPGSSRIAGQSTDGGD